MRRTLSMLALLTTVAASAQSQQAKPGKQAASAPCPMSLTNLNLSPTQQAAFDSIRAEHRAEMTKLMPEHAKMMSAGGDMKMGSKMDMKMDKKMTMTPSDSAAMERSMKAALGAMRGILNDAQRVKFDAAVSAHEAKMASSKNGDEMMACCMECMKDPGHSGAMKAKKPDA